MRGGERGRGPGADHRFHQDRPLPRRGAPERPPTHGSRLVHQLRAPGAPGCVRPWRLVSGLPPAQKVVGFKRGRSADMGRGPWRPGAGPGRSAAVRVARGLPVAVRGGGGTGGRRGPGAAGQGFPDALLLCLPEGKRDNTWSTWVFFQQSFLSSFPKLRATEQTTSAGC